MTCIDSSTIPPIGDRVLEVEDVNLIGVTHKHAVETLRSAPDTCRLLMERGVQPVPVPQHHSIISPSLSSEAEDTATSKPNGSEGSDIDTSSPSHSPVGSQTVEPPYFFVTKGSLTIIPDHHCSLIVKEQKQKLISVNVINFEPMFMNIKLVWTFLSEIECVS